MGFGVIKMKNDKTYKVNEVKDNIVKGLRNSCIVLISITNCNVYRLARLFESFIYPLLLVFQYDDELREFLMNFRDELMNRFVYISDITVDTFENIFDQVVDDVM